MKTVTPKFWHTYVCRSQNKIKLGGFFRKKIKNQNSDTIQSINILGPQNKKCCKFKNVPLSGQRGIHYPCKWDVQKYEWTF